MLMPNIMEPFHRVKRHPTAAIRWALPSLHSPGETLHM